MGQIEIPTKRKIYIAKCNPSDRVWIFESDFNEAKRIYTEAASAYCCDCNRSPSLRDRIINYHCVVVADNRGIKWMRLASEVEKRLFYSRLMEAIYEE